MQLEEAEREKICHHRSNSEMYDHCFRILLLGDSGVGKTSMMNRFAENSFNINMLSTAGVDYKSKLIHLNNKM
jgi:GTPase SAR1 family protein